MKHKSVFSTALRYIILCVIIGSLFFSSSPVVLAAAYGSGSYGGGNYNAGIISIITNTVSSAVSSVASTIASWTCTAQAPSFPPTLYEVDTTGSTAKLYFAPAGSAYTSYYVSFGLGSKDEGNGGQFSLSQSTGALKYDVFFLMPNTTYTFKVRAGNGCKAAPWSGTLGAKTGGKNSKVLAKYYPKQQAVIATSKTQSGLKGWISSLVQRTKSLTGIGVQKKAANTSPQSQPVQKQQPPQQVPIKAPPSQPQPQKPQSLWSKVAGFFHF